MRIIIIIKIVLCTAILVLTASTRLRDGSRHSQNQTHLTRNNLRLVVQLGHSGPVTSVAYSPDGELVLTGSTDKTARLWHASTGKEIRTFTGHTDVVTALALQTSAKGQFLLTGSLDGTARLWDATTGDELRRFETRCCSIYAVALSPEGRLILTGEQNGASLWDARTGQLLHMFSGHAARSVNFSPDGGLAFIADGERGTLWNIITMEKVKSLEGHNRAITAAVFSQDGRQLFTASGSYKIGPWPVEGDSTVRVWDLRADKEPEVINSVLLSAMAISPDDRLLVTWSYKNFGVVWDLADRKSLGVFQGTQDPKSFGPTSVTFSPNGDYLITGSRDIFDRTMDRAAHLWDVRDRKEVRRFEGNSSAINSVALSRKEHFILVGGAKGTVVLWNQNKGGIEKWFRGHSSEVNSVAFSPDDNFLLTGSGTIRLIGPPENRLIVGDQDAVARLYDVTTQQEIKRFGESSGIIHSVAFSPDGGLVLIAAYDVATDEHSVSLWELATQKRVGTLGRHSADVNAVAFSPDGRFIVTGSDVTRVWDASTKKLIHSFELPRYAKSIAISSDSRLVIVGTPSGQTRIWNLINGNKVTQFSEPAVSGAFSASANTALTGGADGSVYLWDVASGNPIRKFSGHSGPVNTVSFSQDEQFIITGSEDNTVRFWNADAGIELCRLVSREDNWIVVAPDGRFDSNNLEEIEGLHWIISDDPMKPLPLEIFMRDYYEPRLLPRMLKCTQDANCDKEFKPVRDLMSLNRTQPTVEIVEINRVPKTDTVDVTVEVRRVTSDRQRDHQNRLLQSGVYDVRLFRDGQIVGYMQPTAAQAVASRKQSGEAELDEWRQTNKVSLDADGKATITFSGIKLPHRTEPKQIEFSGYAFNSDRVKSRTDRKTFDIPSDITSMKGRAYIISVGVNAYENPDFDLEFAADDARRVERTVTEKLNATGQYEKVVPISLISDYKTVGKNKIPTVRDASKSNFKAVLQLLSKQSTEVDRKQLAGITNIEELRQATPDDLVLIMFSSHGYADRDGNFYFIPYDTGPGTGKVFTDTVRQHSISSDELSLWLRDVDGGEMLMIVDACHSQAAVAGHEFKPGPMGSRGLGQLSYDKGMRILTATQADNVAWEYPTLKQGVLTYALVRDGIEAKQADFKPKDGAITLAEWLSYATERVPRLYEEVRAGKVQNFGLTASVQPKLVVITGQGTRAASRKDLEEVLIQSKTTTRPTQRPSLFDFAKRKRDVVLLSPK